MGWGRRAAAPPGASATRAGHAGEGVAARAVRCRPSRRCGTPTPTPRQSTRSASWWGATCCSTSSCPARAGAGRTPAPSARSRAWNYAGDAIPRKAGHAPARRSTAATSFWYAFAREEVVAVPAPDVRLRRARSARRDTTGVSLGAFQATRGIAPSREHRNDEPASGPGTSTSGTATRIRYNDLNEDSDRQGDQVLFWRRTSEESRHRPCSSYRLAAGRRRSRSAALPLQEAMSTLFSVAIWARSPNDDLDLDGPGRVSPRLPDRRGRHGRRWAGILRSPGAGSRPSPPASRRTTSPIVPTVWAPRAAHEPPDIPAKGTPDINDELLGG